ncbi:MAG TPA: rod shape-determining protein MreD [Sedimentisphaerales bacterium]|jgi:rod shape-determining protein MreD|nr:rod shape-determining protein MreD [Sedimentisphaerales bacterium]HNU30256.1 rod shape-determining protein MreD [Sedimentisphaerales bacterium]
MRWIRFAVLVLLASVLQAGPMSVLGVGRPGVKPDLLLILLVFFASRCNATNTVITSFAIGFVADLAAPIHDVMGPRTLSFGLFGTLLFDLQTVFSIRRPIYQGAAIVVMGFLTAALSCLLAAIRTGGETNLAAQLLWQPLYSGVLGPLFSLPAGWWMHMNRKSRRLYGRTSRQKQ